MGVAKRLGLCRENFAPEESFQSWENYARALKETGTRLKDRVLTRAQAEVELGEVRERSGHDMKKELTWWDLIWLGVGSVIGSGIFVLTGIEAQSEARPAVILSFVISGISALLAVFCYTEFAVEIPSADILASEGWTLRSSILLIDCRSLESYMPTLEQENIRTAHKRDLSEFIRYLAEDAPYSKVSLNTFVPQLGGSPRVATTTYVSLCNLGFGNSAPYIRNSCFCQIRFTKPYSDSLNHTPRLLRSGNSRSELPREAVFGTCPIPGTS